jgi:hypothetical protein
MLQEMPGLCDQRVDVSIIFLQVNIEALLLVPPQHAVETLLYQLMHLRLCLDLITKKHANQVIGCDAAATGQQPRGRDQRPAANVQQMQ